VNTKKELPQIGDRGDIGLDRSIFRNTGIVFQVNALEGENGRVGRIPEVMGNAVGIETGGIAKSSIGEGSFDIFCAGDLMGASLFL